MWKSYSIGGELRRANGQAQHGMSFDFKVQFDIEGQGKLPHKTIGVLTKAFRTSQWSKFEDPSLNGWWVIARTNSWSTHGRTDRDTANDNARRPKLASDDDTDDDNDDIDDDAVWTP